MSLRKITFNPLKKEVFVREGSPLLQAAKEAGISVETPCGGMGACAKCLVKIESGTVAFENKGMLSEELINQGFVMICRAFAGGGDAEITVFSDLSREKGKFSNIIEDYFRLDEDLVPKSDEISFIVKKKELSVKGPRTGDGLSDLDRLKTAICQWQGDKSPIIPLSALRALPSALRADEGNIFVYYYSDENNIHIIHICAACEDFPKYGVAVDIGTTTVAAELVSESGEILQAKTAYNAQLECGLDVISRINYAKKKGGLKLLRQKVLQTVNELIDGLCREQEIDENQIITASVAANTTMVQLLLGIEPEYIRLEPYTPAIHSVPVYTAETVGINILKSAPVDIAESAGSYVGGDITAGMLCTSLAGESEEVCLFIDIGTNGEIVLGNSEFLLSCACSAGPAFEGGGIDCGMRASAGAIERVLIDDITKEPEIFTIGNTEPEGICGSGVISLIAELFSKGLIDAAGKLYREKSSRIITRGKTACYILAETGEKTISVSETDIENLIRAKAAVFSACNIMLKSIGLSFPDLSRVYISGGFGRYLNQDNARTIGLIPGLPAEKYTFLGNSSLMGTYMSLVSERHRNKRRELHGKTTYIDLSAEGGYMDEYMAAMFLPHTDEALFE